MLDHTIASEGRLCLYLSARLLQELQVAFQLMGIPSAYIRPGVEGVNFPRLYLGSTTYEPRVPEEADDSFALLVEFICAAPFLLPGQPRSRLAPEVEWWFMWWSDRLAPVCPATDMRQAARVIWEYEEPA